MAAGEKIGSIYFDLDLDDKKFKSGLNSAGKGTKTLGDRMKAAEKGSFALLASVTALTVGAIAFGVKSVQAFNVQAAAEAKLIQLHQKNTGATEAQTKSLMDLASEVQNYGVIGDEAIISGQAQLSTFKLSTDAIKSLTPAMTDMVAQQKGVNATGDDFVNIGNLIGKVMEGNIGALGRYGVSFNEASEEILRNGSETEKAAELAKVLEANYGGVNKALRDTPEGKMQALKNRFGDLQEGLGGLIVKGLDPLMNKFDGFMTKIEDAGGFMEYFGSMIKDNQDKIAMIAGAIMVGLVPALYAMAAGMWATFAPLIPFLAVGAALGLLLKVLADRLGGWGKLWEATKKVISPIIGVIKTVIGVLSGIVGWFQQTEIAMWALGGVVIALLIPAVISMIVGLWGVVTGLGAIAVAAIAAALPFLPLILLGAAIGAIAFLIIKNWETLKQWFATAWQFIKNVFAGFINWVKSNWPLLLAIITGPIGMAVFMIVKHWETIKAAFGAALNFIKMIFGAVVGWIVGRINNIKNNFIWAFNLIRSVVSAVGNAIASPFINAFNFIRRAIDTVISKFREITGSVGRALSGVGEGIMSPFRKAFDWIKEKAQWAKDQLNKINPFHRSSPSLVDYIERGSNRIVGLYDNMFNDIAGMSQNARGTLTGTAQTLANATGGLNTGASIAQPPINVTIAPQGIVARSRSEFRDIIADGIEAVNEDLTARGVSPIGDGKVHGSSNAK